MWTFKEVNHPDEKPICKSYACRATLCNDKDEPIGSFWVVGNPWNYVLRSDLEAYEIPAHFFLVDIDKLTEEDINYVTS